MCCLGSRKAPHGPCPVRPPQAAGVNHAVSVEEVEEGDADELASRLRAIVMQVCACDGVRM